MKRSKGAIGVRLAMSLDGYIADGDGGYDWIEPVPSPSLDTAHQLPFDEFLDDVDVVVMGRRCYDQGQHRDYAPLGKRVIVATSKPPLRVDGEEYVEFSRDVVDVVRSARNQGNTASSSEAASWSSHSSGQTLLTASRWESCPSCSAAADPYSADDTPNWVSDSSTTAFRTARSASSTSVAESNLLRITPDL
jgi:hypothetical protein